MKLDGGGLIGRIVAAFLTGNLAPLLLLLSVACGFAALAGTPREEEPQIVVPAADVVVRVPGASALEVERQVATKLEKLLLQIDGVEHVYSASRAGGAVVTVRFFVGEDREDSLVKLQTKLAMHADEIPPQVVDWVVEPISIDDVPIVAVTLHSERLDDHALRRVAEEIEAHLQQVPDSGRTTILGGRPRRIEVRFEPASLAARGIGVAQLAAALRAATTTAIAGTGEWLDRSWLVEPGAVGTDLATLGALVVGGEQGRPVHLRDVATLHDGAADRTAWVTFASGDAPPRPAVTLAIAKRKGADAVAVARSVRARLAELREQILPDGVEWSITRDQGRTADAKVDELLEGLWVAVAIVVLLIAMMLGWREGLVVASAVPITFALTLFVNWLAGYTINRVTLFALILALGLVVDDPIVDVENIHRHLRRGTRDPLRAVFDAVNEVRPPVILATLAVIVSFVPLFFITGMMGPYMRPMALNVPLAMLMSMLVAFTLTPWMSYRLFARRAVIAHGADPEAAAPLVRRIYGAVLMPLLRSRRWRWSTYAVTGALFAGALGLGVARDVPFKMLPYDDKDELQVLIDLPEGASLERTAAVAGALAQRARGLPDVVDVTSYAGVPSPLDFNGIVRKYDLRHGPHLADLRINLRSKHDRTLQSHEIALQLRAELAPLAADSGAVLQIVETPPGPPVLATIVAELRGPPQATPGELAAAAQLVAQRLAREPGVADVDTTVELARPELRFELDHEKGALHGITAAAVSELLRAAVGGDRVAVLHEPRDVEPLQVELRLAPWQRAAPAELARLPLPAIDGGVVALGEIGRFVEAEQPGVILRKDLERVQFITAEANGRAPAEIILDLQQDELPAGSEVPAPRPRPVGERSYLRRGGGVPWSLPAGFRVDWRGEGEWKITLDAFRDLGLAFLAACFGIYVLLVHETRSYRIPLVLMLSIPFTMLGILPGFWLLGRMFDRPVAGIGTPVFFTATAMIGMIALAGIAVRNAILLIDFIAAARRRGAALEDAILDSGAVRLRPIVLTAGTAMLAAIPITLDPIFSGLAWALIFGLLVSSLFTLVLVPVVYRGLAQRLAA